MMSEVLSLAYSKDLVFTSARWAIIECFEQKSDTIFKQNPLQGCRIDWKGDKDRRVRASVVGSSNNPGQR